jgi:hypothetical protein
MAALRRMLAFAAGGIVILPMVATVLVGLAGLLRSAGDPTGSAWCLRMASLTAAGWMVAIAVTAATAAALILAALPEGWPVEEARPDDTPSGVQE